MEKSRAAFPQLPPQERAAAFPPGQKMATCKIGPRGRMGFSPSRATTKVASIIGGGGACASSGGTLVEAMREAQPYFVAHRGSTFVVVLSTEIIDSSHLSSILQGCLGALDGTYIDVQVPNCDKPRFRTRKGHISTNTLAVCDRHLRFVYILPGWEGSAGDARILRDAVNRVHGLKVPKDFIEKKASSLGLRTLFLLTTRTADWFVRRGFCECLIEHIPEERRRRINTSLRSKYYMKKLLPDRSGIRLKGAFA